MLKILTSAALLLCAVAAQAADDAAQTITDALHKVAPQATIQSIAESTVPGFYSVVTDGHVILMSGDGKYLIEGHVYDINARQDLMQEGMGEARKVGLAKISKDKKLVFAPPHPKYTVTVFTDVDCPFCRQFHKQIAEYNKLGIAVEYVLYPLSIHPGADKKAQSVWCEKDRNTAYTNAMNGQTLPQKTCSNPIAEVSNIASTMGINGTPAIITSDGTQLGGYVAPDQLVKELEDLEKKKPTTAQ